MMILPEWLIAQNGSMFNCPAGADLSVSLLERQSAGLLERGYAAGAAPPVGVHHRRAQNFDLVCEIKLNANDLATFSVTLETTF
ncbi:MAG TPA: hypothetical protein VHZ28_16205 [Terracidiphilus sp.]|nr:hypothetical protein [Terracidiphilus sp.]